MASFTYKEEHEAFVSNLKGTSIGCIYFCLSHVPALVLLLKLVQANRRPRLLRDFTFLVIPILLIITLLADQSFWTLPCLLLGEILAINRLQFRKGLGVFIGDIPSSGNVNTISSNKKTYLSLFKGKRMVFVVVLRY